MIDTGFSGFAIASDIEKLKKAVNFKATNFRKVQKRSEIARHKFTFGNSQVYLPQYVCDVAFPTSTHILEFECLIIDAKIPLLIGQRFLVSIHAKIDIVTNSVESDYGKFQNSDDQTDAFNVQDENLAIGNDTDQDEFPTDSKDLRRILQKRCPKQRKLFGLTRVQLQKLHSQRHVGADQTLRNLRAILDEAQGYDGDVQEFLI